MMSDLITSTSTDTNFDLQSEFSGPVSEWSYILKLLTPHTRAYHFAMGVANS